MSKNAEPVCPYCGYIFESMPTRKRKCPKCQETIYRQSYPPDNIKRLMTEHQAAAAKKQWDEYQAKKEQAEINEYIDIINKPGDHPGKRTAFIMLSRFFYKKGPEFHEKAFELQQLGFVEELNRHLSNNRGSRTPIKVKIGYGPYTCTHLRPDFPVIYSLEDAIKEMPIPHREPYKGQCGCWYDLVLPDDAEYNMMPNNKTILGEYSVIEKKPILLSLDYNDNNHKSIHYTENNSAGKAVFITRKIINPEIKNNNKNLSTSNEEYKSTQDPLKTKNKFRIHSGIVFFIVIIFLAVMMSIKLANRLL